MCFQVKINSSWHNRCIRMFFTANKAEIVVHSRAGAVVSLEKVIHDKVISFYNNMAHWDVAYLLWIWTTLSFRVQIILNGMTVTMQRQLSIAVLSWGFNIHWMIISFPLLSLSLTCRNSQFMQAAPWPGKVDAPQRRKAAMFQTMKMNSGTTQGWFRSWTTWN